LTSEGCRYDSAALAAECSASVDIRTSDTCDVGGEEVDAVSVKVSARMVRRKLAAGKWPLEAIRCLILDPPVILLV
jgi:hypothetical protein